MSRPAEDRFPAPRFVPACTQLRTKTQFYRQEDQEQPAGMVADSPVLTYWCELTQDFLGPDSKACDPRRCQRGRACFQAGADLA